MVLQFLKFFLVLRHMVKLLHKVDMELEREAGSLNGLQAQFKRFVNPDDKASKERSDRRS